jgi:hypothetical protein
MRPGILRLALLKRRVAHADPVSAVWCHLFCMSGRHQYLPSPAGHRAGAKALKRLRTKMVFIPGKKRKMKRLSNAGFSRPHHLTVPTDKH